MPFTTADRLAIHELLALHGHVSDTGDFARFPEIFTDNVEYDLTAYGAGVITGIPSLIALALQLGDRNPLAHHVTNIIVTPTTPTSAQALSKGLAVNLDGTTASVTYEDTLHQTPAGWRITHCRVLPRQKPLTP
ncbi:nuclear transport factor 2 family protein [Nocardia yunnanensis]|uniref:Nuclear transport factor 2 family protein n=1 Tax=Nocardia yunnanensis TaxID=2382165 RepID=A0A386ZK23_9NOCA|nr:nuclear transport factor 2 family protein [Nocardia yunnanensis]AYF76945.1 nuclear transport factor 2 family protein [Nocardia yunnanensis]